MATLVSIADTWTSSEHVENAASSYRLSQSHRQRPEFEDDVCVVKEIVPGGPADLGKQLKPNDKIISVGEKGGEPVEILGMKLRKIVDKIRGKKGTQVSLIVQPADATDSSVRKEIVITRDTVKLNSARARGAVFEVPTQAKEGVVNQKLGVITLPAFYNEGDEGDTDSERSSASKDVARLIEQLKAQGIQGLVLDLRRNGGSYLTEAIELTGLFIQGAGHGTNYVAYISRC